MCRWPFAPRVLRDSTLTYTSESRRGLPVHPRPLTNGERHDISSAELGLRGAGYAVSRGLMNSVQRPKWKRCVDQEICGNADQRVTRCVLNLGWAFTDPSRDTEPPWKGGLGHHLSMSNNRNRGSRLLRRWRRSRRRLARWG